MLEWILLGLGSAGLVGLSAARRQRLLDQPVRKRLLGTIRDQPGIHASELCRQTGESWGTVQYHLGLLDKADMVQSVELGRERRFFSGIGNNRARLLALMNKGRSQEIAAFIQNNPGARQVDICKALNVSRKTFRHTMKHLADEGLVREQRGLQSNRYFPEDALESALERDPAAGMADGPEDRRFL